MRGGCRVVLLCAPLGYGKTTLLAQYCCGLSNAWAWYRCDRSDNQPLSLLMHLASALQLPPWQCQAASIDEERAWAAIVSYLESLNQPFTLVFDDLHHLQNQRVIAYLNELLHDPPANLIVVAGSQGMPHLATTHLKRNQRLLIMDSNDFILNSEEVSALARSRERPPSADLIYRLHATNEGWISGILFGLNVYDDYRRSHQDAPDDVQSIVRQALNTSGLFINEELLRRLPADLMLFLERTCTVNAFDERLAEYLSDQPAVRFISRIDRLGLFLQQRNDEQLPYRYHPALRHSLYQRLRGNPEVLRLQHLKAADWLLEQRHFVETAYHLGRSRAFDRLYSFIEKYSFQLLKEGRVGTMLDMLASMPDQHVDHVTQTITEASTVIVTNDIENARRCLTRLERLLRHDIIHDRHPERIRQTIALLRSRIAYLGGNFAHGLRVIADAEKWAPSKANAASAVLCFNRASCLAALGHLNEARPQAETALSILESLGINGYTDSIRLLLCQLELAQGKAQLAAGRLGALLGCFAVTSENFYDLYQMLAQGLLFLHQNKLEQAARYISQAKTVAMNFPHSAALPWVIHHQACLLAASGQIDQAREHWQEVRRMTQQFKLFSLYRLAGAWLARLSAIDHDEQFVDQWLREWHQCRRRYGHDLLPEEWLAYAWIQRMLGQHRTAWSIANNLAASAKAEQNHVLELNVLILRSRLSQDKTDSQAVTDSLEAALQLAARLKLGHLLHLEGRSLEPALKELTNPQTRLRLGLTEPLPERDTLNCLLPASDTFSRQGLFEPVTRRELDVLRGIAKNQSNQVIADGLHISISTVKTHINNLFRKLDANDRTGALRRAKDVGLSI